MKNIGINILFCWQSRFHSIAMAVVSFYEVDFSYDSQYLVNALSEAKTTLINLVQRHLTDKSASRVEHIFGVLGNQEFLDAVFRRDSPHRDQLARLVTDMNRAMDEGVL